jgi:hypothetical protein
VREETIAPGKKKIEEKGDLTIGKRPGLDDHPEKPSGGLSRT